MRSSGLLVKNNRYDEAFGLYALNDNFGIIREGVASHIAQVSSYYYLAPVYYQNERRENNYTFYLVPSLYLTPWHLVRSACNPKQVNAVKRVLCFEGKNCIGLGWYATKDIDAGSEIRGDSLLRKEGDSKEDEDKKEVIRTQSLRSLIDGYIKELGSLIGTVRELNEKIPPENRYDYKTKSKQERIL